MDLIQGCVSQMLVRLLLSGYKICCTCTVGMTHESPFPARRGRNDYMTVELRS